MHDRARLEKTQLSLARHQKYYPGDTAFNLAFLTKVSGPLEPERLRRALESVSSENDTFRTDFLEQDGLPYQRMDRTRQPMVSVFRRAENVAEDDFVREVHEYAWTLQNTAPRQQWPLHDTSLHLVSPEQAYIVTCAPHLIADGYGYSLWLSSVSESYNRGLAWQRPPASTDTLPPEDRFPVELKGKRSRESREFFAQELRQLHSLEMPSFTQPRSDAGGIHGRTVAFDIPRDSLDAVLREKKLSPSQFFFAVYACLLRRLAPSDPVIVGYAVPGRSVANRQEIGCFINTVPAVLDIHDSMSTREVADLIGKKLFRLHRYQNYDPSAFPAVSPRMTSLFTFYPEEFNYVLDGCACTSIPVERIHLPAEIRLTVETRAAIYRPVFDLGSYFDAIDVRAEFERVLRSACDQPDLPIAKLPLSQSVAEGGTLEVPSGDRVAGRFSAVVAAHGQRQAVRQSDQSLNYGELDQLSGRLADALRPRVAGCRNIVLSAESGVNAVATILAILRLGKTYVPVDPKLPATRVSQILDDLDSPFVIAQGPMTARTPCVSLAVLMEEARSGLDDQWTDDGLDPAPDQPAYIIYTSGSTGVPKGVPVSHRNLLSLMDACNQQFGFEPEDVWTLFHSLSFDYSIWEIFGCLLHGGKLVIPDRETMQDPARFYSFLHREGVTILNHTPSVFKSLIREDRLREAVIRPRTVFLGGEALHFSILQDWVDKHPLEQTRIVNLYGPTEATVLATTYTVRHEDLAETRSLIGFPIAGSSVSIRTLEGSLAVQGVPGEVVLAGTGIAAGYYKRDEATTAKFLLDSTPAGFRTGDLGRMHPGGLLEYQGRIDRQVKVRGFRLELAEIETALRKAGMTDSAVDLVEFEGQEDSRLVAYVVPGAVPFSEQSVRATLKELLPAYMAPSVFVQVPCIPVNLSGKVDFPELAQRVRVVSSETKGGTETETWLSGLIAAKLKHSNFEVTDNLLDIGFNSLDIVALVSQIRARYPKLAIRVLDVFEYPTVQSLARYLEQTVRPAHDTAGAAERGNMRQTMLAAQRSSTRVSV